MNKQFLEGVKNSINSAIKSELKKVIEFNRNFAKHNPQFKGLDECIDYIEETYDAKLVEKHLKH